MRDSLIISGSATLLTVLVGATVTYSMARFRTGGARLSRWFLAQRMMPPVVMILPIFLLFRTVRLLDTHVGLILLYTVFNLALAVWIINKKPRVSDLKPGTLNLVSGLSRRWIIVPLLVVTILVSVTAATLPDDNLRVSFLDVGQGDAILIQKGNRQILVDGGPNPQMLVSELSEKIPFWDRTIDLVVLTHPSADHVTGLVEILQRYEVGQVIHPGLDYESMVYDRWLHLLEESDINTTITRTGQQIKMSEVTIEVLNPGVNLLKGTQSVIDNNGLVLRVEKGEVSFLLTADLMQEAEYELITRRANLTSIVLKVAHHGSNTSTTVEFLAVTNPQLAVISVGEQNKFGHPTDEVLDRLEQKIGNENVYRTDNHGTIEFITDGEKLWVRVDR